MEAAISSLHDLLKRMSPPLALYYTDPAQHIKNRTIFKDLDDLERHPSDEWILVSPARHT